jgi:hypothetical protein
VVLTNLQAHIFATPHTFHGTTIGNHDLKIVDYTDIEHGLLSNMGINKIMGDATIN